jgi:hypothetical protein
VQSHSCPFSACQFSHDVGGCAAPAPRVQAVTPGTPMTSRAWTTVEDADCDCAEDAAQDGVPAAVNAVTPHAAKVFSAPAFVAPAFAAPAHAAKEFAAQVFSPSVVAPREAYEASYPAYAPFVPIGAAEQAANAPRPCFFIPTSIQNRNHSPRPYSTAPKRGNTVVMPKEGAHAPRAVPECLATTGACLFDRFPAGTCPGAGLLRAGLRGARSPRPRRRRRTSFPSLSCLDRIRS